MQNQSSICPRPSPTQHTPLRTHTPLRNLQPPPPTPVFRTQSGATAKCRRQRPPWWFPPQRSCGKAGRRTAARPPLGRPHQPRHPPPPGTTSVFGKEEKHEVGCVCVSTYCPCCNTTLPHSAFPPRPLPPSLCSAGHLKQPRHQQHTLTSVSSA